MADSDKLWFELGVRDKVSSEVKKMLADANDLGRAYEDISNKLGSMVDQANKEVRLNSLAMQQQRKEAEKLSEIYERLEKKLDKMTNRNVNIEFKGNTDALDMIEKKILELTSYQQEIGAHINKNIALQVKSPSEGILTTIKQLESEFDKVGNQIEHLYAVYEKMQSMKGSVVSGDALGLGHINKEMEDTATATAKHEQRRREIEAAFAKDKADQMRVEELLQMRRHKNSMEQARDDREVAAVAKQVNRAIKEKSEMERNAAKVAREHAQAVREQSQASMNLVATFERLTEKGSESNRLMSQLTQQMGAYFSLYGAERLIKSVIQIGGEFELQHIALQNILGDVEQANTLFSQMKTLAVVSPFNFRQLTSYAKQTSAFGVPYEELYDTTKRLADMSAGLGVDMGRLILAYGQVRSAAVLRGQELRQFTEAGIPMVQALADKFTELDGRVTTTAEVFKLISQRAVPFEMVRDILWDMTNAGGRFFNMQYKLSDTLLGKWSNLQDAWEIMLSDFAKGDSVSGRFLKNIVQGLTDLLDNIERVTPLIAGFFTAITSKKVASGLFGDIHKDFLKAKQLEASRLAVKSITEELSDREKDILNTAKEITAEDLKVLIQTGKVNTLELQKLYLNKKITAGKIEQLHTEGLIDAAQKRQILNATRLSVAWASFKNLGRGIVSGAVGVLTNPTTWIMAGIAAASSLYAAWKQAEDAMAEVSKEVGNTMQENYNTALKSVHEINKLSPTNNSEYFKGINEIKNTMEALGTYTPEIEKHANAIDNISERYAYLKEKMEETANVYERLASYAETASEYVLESTDGYFDESIVTNMKDLDNTLDKYDKAAITIQRYGSIIQEQINKFLSFNGNTELSKAIDGKSLEEQLKIIAETPYWHNIQDMVGETSTKAHDALADFNEKYADVVSSWSTLTEDDVPKMIRSIEEVFKREHPDIDFTNLNSEMEMELSRFVHQTLQKVQNVRDDIKKKLEEDIDAHFNINVTTTFNMAAPPDFWRVEAPLLNQAFGKITGKGMNMPNSFYNDLTKDASTEESLWKAMDDRVEKSAAHAKATMALFGKGSEEYEKAEKAAEDYRRARDAAFGGAMNQKNKTKKTGSGKDSELEEAKTRLDEIKKFYAEYKKFRETMGEEQAKLKVEEIFGIDASKGDEIINNYKGVLEGVLNGLSLNTEQRKKFATSVRQALADIDLDKVKQDLSRKLQDIQESLSRQAEQWNLYKTLLEKTGDKSLAMSAFSDGIVFDDLANSMADRLRQAMEKNLRQGAPLVIDWDADEQSAEDYFKKNFEDGEVLYKQWQEIVKLLHKNYTDGLNEVATATEKLMSTNEKILKAEAELTELRNKYGANDPRVMVKEKELNDLRVKQFEESEAYLRFYAGILALTTDEAENIGSAIKKNLVDQLATGAINADKFLKSIKNVEQQLATSRNRKSDFLALATGGLNGYFSNRESRANDSIAADAIKIDAAQKRIDAERKKLQAAQTKGDKEGIMAAQLRIALSELDISLAKERMKQQQTLLISNDKQRKSLNKIAGIIDTIAGAIDGAQQAAQQLSDMFDALGHEGSANTWSDISDVIGIVGSPVKSAGNAIKSALSGDIGGVISNAVGMITSPITGIAQLHDKKREREIEKSTQRLKALTAAFGNLQGAMEKALGGIYTSGGYNEMYANLQAQRNELQKQYDLEDDKKKKDKDKLADYQQQLKELDDQIKTYALDMAKSLYDIDLQSWARQLTESIVGAWEKGEDAVEAYKTKIKDLMKDLTTNILAKKVMERAFDSLGIDELIASIMDASAGKLDANAIPKLAEALGQAGNLTVDTITRTLDEMERQGHIEKESENSSGSSVTNSIKSITENTADLLASYINAIRADVSVNRMTLTEILNAVQNQVEMPVIARAQLERLSAIVENTSRNALAAEQIYSLLSGNINKVNKFNI